MINKLYLLIIVLFLTACSGDNESSNVQNNQTKNKASKTNTVAKAKKKEMKKLVEVVKQTDNSKKSVEKTAATKTNKVKESPDAENFSYPDLDGKIVKLSDYRGKWVIANFWATWCPPCRKEIPDFIKLKNLYGDKVEILGINNEDADLDKIQDFVFEYEINYPVLRADVYNPSDFSKINTMALPTTLIFNPQGIQVDKRVGGIHFKDLVKIIGLNKPK